MDTNPNSIVQVKDLSFQYPRAHPLFRAINIFLDGPGFYSIFGRSGTGKSTLGKIIAGRLVPRPLVGVSVPRPALYASSEDILPSWLSVSEHLNEFLKGKEQKSQLEAFLKVADLPEALSAHRPTELSLGQRQRFNLARYLLREAPCLVLDEALIGVDQPTRWKILEWIKEHRKSWITILISHEIEDVALFSQAIVKLSVGTPAEVTMISGLNLQHVEDPAAIAGYGAIRGALLAP
ncbi:MAG TPA: ATP-binding cassette domain-containing protein [Rhizomicrobium sp.]